MFKEFMQNIRNHIKYGRNINRLRQELEDWCNARPEVVQSGKRVSLQINMFDKEINAQSNTYYNSIIISKGCINKLKRKQLLFVLGHELAHIVLSHTNRHIDFLSCNSNKFHNQEFAADKLGLKISGVSKKDAISFFEDTNTDNISMFGQGLTHPAPINRIKRLKSL